MLCSLNREWLMGTQTVWSDCIPMGLQAKKFLQAVLVTGRQLPAPLGVIQTLPL